MPNDSQTQRDDRLERIETKVDQILVISTQFQALKEAFDEHVIEDRSIFLGNGQPGLIKQVDRLEQKMQNWTWWSRSVVGLGGLIFVKIIYDTLVFLHLIP